MKNVFGVILGILVGLTRLAWAQSAQPRGLPLPNFSVNTVETKQLKVDNQGFTYPPEITPMVLTQPNGKKLYVLSSSWSWLCESTGNLLESSPAAPLHLLAQDCKMITKLVILDHVASDGALVFRPRNQIPDAEWMQDWRRTYDGVLGIHLAGNRLLAIKHGEHANARFDGNDYQGDLFPSCQINNCCICNPNACYTDAIQPACNSMADCQWHCCFSGYNAGSYYQCWESFGSFATLSWAPYEPAGGWQQEEWNDEGPVYWPDSPYLQGDAPYHTTLFVDDGYLYLFTIDKREEGGAQCAVAARAPLSGQGLPGTWKSYANGSFANDSLPLGFDKANIRSFYSQAGGAADCIFQDESQNAFIWFNVARIVGTPYFIGAEESSPNYATWQVGVRISTDLVNWSAQQILSSSSGGWGTGWYSYPTFFDRLNSGNTDVDPWDFYLLGTHATGSAGYELNAMRLAFNCPSLSAPAGLSPSGKIPAGNASIQWTPRSDVAFYSIRINDLADGWNYAGSCQQQSPLDFCADDVLDSSFTFTAQAGHAYDYWIHERNLCGNWGEATMGHFEVWPDADGDGFGADTDCNDNDPSIYPGATELCNNVDDNCNGVTDEGCAPDGGPDANTDGGDIAADSDLSGSEDGASEADEVSQEGTDESEQGDASELADMTTAAEEESTPDTTGHGVSGSCGCSSAPIVEGLLCAVAFPFLKRKRRHVQ